MEWDVLLCRRSVHAQSKTIDKTFLIWACWGHRVARGAAKNTFDAFLKVLCWSLTWLWRGEWPTEDWDGVKYRKGSWQYKAAHTNNGRQADGHFGLLFCFQHDLDWGYKTYGLPNPNRIDGGPCPLCACNSSGHMNLIDFSMDAAWREPIWSRATFLARFPEHCAVFDLPFISIALYCSDYMHNKHLGVNTYFHGSVLWLLSYCRLDGTPTANLGLISKGV